MSIGTVSYVMATEDHWVTKEPMQQARSGLGVAAVNRKIYAIGGVISSGFAGPTPGSTVYFSKDPVEVTGSNEEYDPATDTWTYKAAMPTPRAVFATAVYQNKIYCIGGKTSDNYTGVNEVYDPATDTWETKTPMPTARAFLDANVVGGKIYLIGGHSLFPYEFLLVSEVYDPATDTWSTSEPMPSGTLAGYASAVFDNKIYIIGGFSQDSIRNQIYDTETGSWHYGTSPPSWGNAAGATTGIMAPKQIYVVGYTDVGVYYLETDSWSLGAHVTTSRFNFGVAVVDDTLYAIGGHTYNMLPGDYKPIATNEQYIPIGYGKPDPSYVPPDTFAPEISVISPENETRYKPDLPLIFVVSETASWMRYKLDGKTVIEIEGNSTLNELSVGLHNLTVYVTDVGGNTGAFETIYFTVDNTAPLVTILTPENITYDAEVPLNFTVDEEVSRVCYSIDGQETVPITGNTTLSGLTGGLHNITVYAEDEAGNIGASTAATFTVAKPEYPLTTLVAIASGASLAVAATGLLLYLKKRKNTTKNARDNANN